MPLNHRLSDQVQYSVKASRTSNQAWSKGLDAGFRFSPFLWATKALRMSRDIALLFLGPRDSRWGWGQTHIPAAYTPEKDPVHILQEAGWTSGPLWTGGKPLSHRDSIPDRPACSSVAIPTELPGPLRRRYIP